MIFICLRGFHFSVAMLKLNRIITQMKGFVSKQTVMPCGWGGETRKFVIKQVDDFHREKISKLTFRQVTLIQSESRRRDNARDSSFRIIYGGNLTLIDSFVPKNFRELLLSQSENVPSKSGMASASCPPSILGFGHGCAWSKKVWSVDSLLGCRGHLLPIAS